MSGGGDCWGWDWFPVPPTPPWTAKKPKLRPWIGPSRTFLGHLNSSQFSRLMALSGKDKFWTGSGELNKFYTNKTHPGVYIVILDD